MDCLELETLLRYLHQESNSAEMATSQRHLAHCQQCGQELAVLQALEMHLRKLPEPAHSQPHSAAACLDIKTLAAYIDKRLTGPEREQIEGHLSGCQTCLDELMAGAQQLRSLAATPLYAPSHLLEKARAIGTAKTPATSPPWLQLFHHCWSWAEYFFLRPRWGLAWSGIAVAVLLVLYFGLLPLRESVDPVVRTDPGQQVQGYGFGTSEEVRMQGRVRLSSMLRDALRFYQEHPTAAEARMQLLALLGQEPLRVPGDHVATIEIKRSLQVRLQSAPEELHEVQVTLLTDGLLIITEVE